MALEYTHKKNVFHRDLKPDNVFITSDGKAKVGDFGLAHLPGKPLSELYNMPLGSSRVGTPRYMAPEGNRSPKSDQYSLALIGWEGVHGTTSLSPSGALFKVSTDFHQRLKKGLAQTEEGRHASIVGLVPNKKSSRKKFLATFVAAAAVTFGIVSFASPSTMSSFAPCDALPKTDWKISELPAEFTKSGMSASSRQGLLKSVRAFDLALKHTKQQMCRLEKREAARGCIFRKQLAVSVGVRHAIATGHWVDIGESETVGLCLAATGQGLSPKDVGRFESEMRTALGAQLWAQEEKPIKARELLREADKLGTPSHSACAVNRNTESMLASTVEDQVELLKKAAECAAKAGDDVLLSRVLLRRAKVQAFRLRNADAALATLEAAESIIVRLGTRSSVLAELKLTQALLLEGDGKYAEAVDLLESSRSMNDEVSWPIRVRIAKLLGKTQNARASVNRLTLLMQEEKQRGGDTLRFATAAYALALKHDQLNEFEKALHYARVAVAIRVRELGKIHDTAVYSRQLEGTLLARLSRLDDLVVLEKELMADLDGVAGMETAWARTAIDHVYTQLSRKRMDLAKAMLSTLKSRKLEDSLKSRVLQVEFKVYFADEDFPRALASANLLVEGLGDVSAFDGDAWTVALAYERRAMAYHQLKQFKQAEQDMKKSWLHLRAKLGAQEIPVLEQQSKWLLMLHSYRPKVALPKIQKLLENDKLSYDARAELTGLQGSK